jgi:hypothetical protein
MRDFEGFRAWRDVPAGMQDGKSAGQKFLEGMPEIRTMLKTADSHYDGTELPPRTDRRNVMVAMVDMLELGFPYMRILMAVRS